MHFFSAKSYLKILAIVALVFVPSIVYGYDGKENTAAVTLGWLAIGCGVAANITLVGFKIVRKKIPMKVVIGSGTSQSLAPLYMPILNFHIMLNSVGFFAGMAHGFFLIRGLDYISLSLVIVMTVSMASGIMLKYTSDKNLKFFNRLIHGQVILAVLLVTLVILHVITKWPHGLGN
ncbi:MAG TPA: hypothetical protein VEJ68_04040 [Candidatus Bathyarchaeia archaeon]|nr:hypothetical protein [Candidatus Bathyarchaeia archaeon]